MESFNTTDIILTFLALPLLLSQYLLFIYLYNSKFEPKYGKTVSRISGIGAAILTFVALSIFNARVGLSDLAYAAIIAGIMAIYLFFFREGEATQKLFWLIFSVMFHGAADAVAAVLSLVLFKSSLTFPNMSTQNAFISTLIVLAIEAIACFIITRKKHRNLAISATESIILSLIPTLLYFIFLSWNEYNRYSSSIDPAFAMLLLVTSISITAICFLVFILYEYMLDNFERRIGQETLRQKAESLEVHNADIMASYNETRSVRHDFSNHVQALKTLADSGEVAELKDYLTDLTDVVENLRLRVNTGVPLLDAIISTKMSVAASKGIEMHIDLQIDPDNLNLSSVDLTALISNLIDNAIEACLRIQNPNVAPSIFFSISTTMQNIIIVVKNSHGGDIVVRDGHYKTSKKSAHHGIGMKQIDAIVKKYNGFIDRQYTSSTFETLIRLSL